MLVPTDLTPAGGRRTGPGRPEDDGFRGRLDAGTRPPRSIEGLHRPGRSVGVAAFASVDGSGRVVWQMDCRNGEILIRAEGTTRGRGVGRGGREGPVARDARAEAGTGGAGPGMTSEGSALAVLYRC